MALLHKSCSWNFCLNAFRWVLVYHCLYFLVLRQNDFQWRQIFISLIKDMDLMISHKHFKEKLVISIFLFDTIIIELLECIGQIYWIHLNWISEIFLWNRVTRFTKHENFITRYIWCELHKTCTSKNPAVLWIKYGFSRHWDMALFKLEVFILLATSYG